MLDWFQDLMHNNKRAYWNGDSNTQIFTSYTVPAFQGVATKLKEENRD